VVKRIKRYGLNFDSYLRFIALFELDGEEGLLNGALAEVRGVILIPSFFSSYAQRCNSAVSLKINKKPRKDVKHS